MTTVSRDRFSAQPFTFDVKDAAQSWLNAPDQNNGILLAAEAPSRSPLVYSSEASSLEKRPRLLLCHKTDPTYCPDPALPWFNPGTGQCEICPADTPEWDPVLQMCKGTCPGGTEAGYDELVTRSFELGATTGTFDFSYEHYTVKDRMIVSYEGNVLFDTGCASGGQTVSIPYAGNSSAVVVEVIPNCEGTTGTAWNFWVGCPT